MDTTCGGWKYEEPDKWGVWSVEDRRPGVVRVDFHRRYQEMQIAVEYDDHVARLRLIASKQLLQEGDNIHRKAVVWIGQLRDRIERTLAQAVGR